MTYRSTERDTLLGAALLALTLAFIFLVSYQVQRWDSDIHWAIKSGEWILANHSVPRTDPFSYTFAGEPWVDFTWGFQVLAYLFYSRLGGYFGLFILQLALVLATFLLLYANLKAVLGRFFPGLAAILVVLVFAASHQRLFIRPHLFEYLFVTIYFLILDSHERRGSKSLVYLLVPLQILWVNAHSSSILGVFITGAYALGGGIDSLRERGLNFKNMPEPLRRIMLVSVLLPFVSVVNPYGLRLAIFPFVHQGADNTDALRHIGEWMTVPVDRLVLNLFPYPPGHFSFELLVAFAAIMLMVNFRRTRARDIILLAGAFYMAASHLRWIPLFAFFAAPVIASNVARRASVDGLFADKRLKGGLLLVGFLVAALLAWDFSSADMRANYGVGLKKPLFPIGTVEFMKKERLDGRIYNDYIFGGYLIMEYPQMKVFIDGRTPTVYSPYFFWASRVARDTGKWKRLEDEYNIDIALVLKQDKLCSGLIKEKGWSPVAFDDASVLFLKQSAHKELVQRRGLSFDPCIDVKGFRIDPNDRARLLKMKDELERYGSFEGQGSGSRHAMLGMVYGYLGNDLREKAVGELKRAVELNPSPLNWYELGRALAMSKRRQEAQVAFNEAIALDPGYKGAYLGLGLLYHDALDHEKAKAKLLNYIKLADDGSEGSAFEALGLSCFETGDFECAVAYLKRALYLNEGGREAARYEYHLGSSLLELGEGNEALKHFRRAVKADRAYEPVIRNLALRLETVARHVDAKIALEALGGPSK